MVFTGDCSTNYIEVESVTLMDGIKICSGSFSYLETQDYEVYIKFVKVNYLIKKHPKGCSAATEVLLARKRLRWEWGNCPRSFSTLQADGFTGITQNQFSAAFIKVRKSLTMSAAQWTSTQVLLRTLWTAKKEAAT